MTYATILVNLEAGRSNAHLPAVAMQVAERFQAGVIGSTACSPVQMVCGDGYAYGDILEQDSKEIERETIVATAEFRDAFCKQIRFLDWRSAMLVTSLSDHLDDVAAWLGRHGVAADVHTIPAFGDDAASFGAVAEERAADIVVAGAYGHSRVQEWALGGVTRTLMRYPIRSSLLSH